MNGHKNWNHWNVSLWINNTEEIYRRAKTLRAVYRARQAAELLLAELPERTPDGAPYTVTTVRAAMRGL